MINRIINYIWTYVAFISTILPSIFLAKKPSYNILQASAWINIRVFIWHWSSQNKYIHPLLYTCRPWVTSLLDIHMHRLRYCNRADSRFAPSQWETALLCNGVSHWLGASLESALLQDSHLSHDLILYIHNYRSFYCWETPILKSMLFGNNFQSWLLIGWQHSGQPIRSQVWKFLLTYRF